MSRTPSRALSLAILGLLCAIALVLSPAATQAAFVNLGPAGDFNVFVFNDNTQFNSDVQGRVAVGGNANFGAPGFTLASNMGAGTDNLIVGGNYSNMNHSLKGGMLVGGDVTWVNPSITGRVAVNGNANFNGGGGEIGTPVLVGGAYLRPDYYPANSYSSPAVFPFSFTDVADYLTDQADNLASLPFNGTTTIAFGGITLTGTDAAFNNFYLSATDLANGTGLTINAPAGSTVVVNVDGANAFFDSQGIFLNGVDKHHVLYNFHNATSLFIDQIGIMGTVLAPRADANFNDGAIDGTMIVKNLTGKGESHLFLFQGNLPPLVPEPTTFALVSLALAGLTTIRRR